MSFDCLIRSLSDCDENLIIFDSNIFSRFFLLSTSSNLFSCFFVLNLIIFFVLNLIGFFVCCLNLIGFFDSININK